MRKLMGFAAVASLGALAPAQADNFSYGSIPDFTIITSAAPIQVTDSVNPALVATISPRVEGGIFTKQPFNPSFPDGTGGYLAETAFGEIGGLRITFSETVFCIPGGPIGGWPFIPFDPLPVDIKWMTYLGGATVASGEIRVEVDPATGLAMGAISFPDGTIDTVDIWATVTTEEGEFPTQFALGDFFALAGVFCPADKTGDQAIDSSDFFIFLEQFFAQDILADANADAVIDSSDFFTYLGMFFEGC